MQADILLAVTRNIETLNALLGMPHWFSMLIFIVSMRFLIVYPVNKFVLGFDMGTYNGANTVASAIGLMHGFTSSIVGYYLLTQMSLPLNISAPMTEMIAENAALTNLLIDFSSGYMVQDLLFLLADAYDFGADKEPMLTSFILHHIGCFIYLRSVAWVKAGHISFFILVFLGEVTNPFQNSRSIALKGLSGDQEHTNKKLCSFVHKICTIILSLLFFVVRMVLGPFVVVYYYYWFLLAENDYVPMWLGALWSTIAFAMIHGSYGFSMDLLKECAEILGLKKKDKTKKQ